ncbi:hypothetical protein JZU48_00165, partial [bacterium]|nr:hypothetical protein [bacterium]
LEREKNRLEGLLRDRLSGVDGGPDSAEAKALEKRHKRLAKALEDMSARGLDKPEDRLTVTEPDAVNLIALDSRLP